jgi:PAS domain S-box-containing protein
MGIDLRESGIAPVGRIPWSTHFCQFYNTKEDLLEIVVTYLAAGLSNNEGCIWAISKNISYIEAVNTLQKAVPDIKERLDKKQLIIGYYSELFGDIENLNYERLQVILKKNYTNAISQGYEGLRVTGDAVGLDRFKKEDFIEYESNINRLIRSLNMIALCSFPLYDCSAVQLIDVVHRHEFALIKQDDKLELLENSVYKNAKYELSRSEEKFKSVFDNSPIGILLFDKNGLLITANNASRAILGISEIPQVSNVCLFDEPNLNPSIKESISRGGSIGFEMLYDFEIVKQTKYYETTKSGTIFVDCLITPIFNENRADIEAYMLKIQDVSLRKLAEDSLNDEKNIIQVIMENTRTNLAYLDRKYNYVKVNSGFARMCSLKPEDLTGKNHFQIFPDMELKGIFDDVLKRGKGINYKDKILSIPFKSTSDGSYWDINITPVHDKEQQTQGVVLSLFETTERKKLEEKLSGINEELEVRVRERTAELEKANKALDNEILKHTEARKNMVNLASNYYNLISSNFDGILIFSSDKNVLFANAAAEKLLGLKAEYMDNSAVGYLADLDDKTEIEIMNKGKKLHAEARIVRLDWKNQSSIMVTLKDITSRKNAEISLNKSKNELEILFNTMTEGVTLIDKEGVVVKTNQAMSKILGLNIDEIEGYHFSKQGRRLFKPDFSESRFDDLPVYHVFNTGEEIQNYELGIQRYDGKTVWVNVSAVPIFDGDGCIEGIVRTYYDITEQKFIEDAYKQTEKKLHLIVSQLPCMLWSTDSDLNVTLFLGAAYNMDIPDGEENKSKISIQEYFKTGNSELPVINAHKLALKGYASSYEYRLNNRVYRAHVEPLKDYYDKIIGTIGIGFDVTEKKHAEEALRALSTRLVDIQENERREIARELHDEIGQSLTALKFMLTQAARQSVDTMPDMLSESQQIVNDLIKEVRDLSLELRPSMLDDLGLLPTLLWYIERYISQTKIEVDFKHSGLNGLSNTKINTSIYRIVQEALTNVARHSQANKVDIIMNTNQDNICISIGDNGKGFNESEISSMKSTGISGMRERVYMLGGRLNIETCIGKGTFVEVELPLTYNNKNGIIRQ